MWNDVCGFGKVRRGVIFETARKVCSVACFAVFDTVVLTGWELVWATCAAFDLNLFRLICNGVLTIAGEPVDAGSHEKV